MSTKFSREIDWFAHAMKFKMREEKNLGKPHWKGLTMKKLLSRAHEELSVELTAAIVEKKDADSIISECCDVANFMMMIADNARKGLL